MKVLESLANRPHVCNTTIILGMNCISIVVVAVFEILLHGQVRGVNTTKIRPHSIPSTPRLEENSFGTHGTNFRVQLNCCISREIIFPTVATGRI